MTHMDNVKETYSKLRDCYTSAQSTNADKAKRFRSIYEDFANNQGAAGGRNVSFGDRLSRLFHWKKASKEAEERSKRLLDHLNMVVHSDCAVSSEQLQDDYKELVLTIQELTGVEPDERTKIMCGMENAWYAVGLNPEQKAAVVDDAQVINVNAGPGTGKTHLLVHKMLYYLCDDPLRAVVALSFTNAAASQLIEKFNEAQRKAGKASVCYTNCLTATIHSFCFMQLSQYYEKKNVPFDFEILDDSDIPAIAEEIALQYGNPAMTNTIASILENGGTGQLADFVEQYKKKHHFIRVEEILDMFISATAQEDFKTWIAGKVDCLLVDESQDLTKKIYTIIATLSNVNPRMNLFFVGDPRQNIFGFNGGSYKNFRSFIQERNVSEHTLTTTYRCPKAVVDKVNPLEFADCPNTNLELADASNAGQCRIIECADRECEAKQIAQLTRKIADNANTAVVCTGLWYLEETASWLNTWEIPFEVKGGRRYLTKPVKMVNYCLRMVMIDGSASEDRLCHLIRNFYDSGLYRYLCQKRDQLISTGKFPLSGLVLDIADQLLDGGYVPKEKKEILEAYAEKAKDYKTVENLLFDCSTHRNDDFVEFYEKDFNMKSTTEATEERPAVTLSTIHSAKGLEWDNVILAGASEGTLPSYKCNEPGISMEEKSERLNDEMKKYYVAVTRCKKNLYITHALTSKSKYGTVFHNDRSQFVISD